MSAWTLGKHLMWWTQNKEDLDVLDFGFNAVQFSTMDLIYGYQKGATKLLAHDVFIQNIYGTAETPRDTTLFISAQCDRGPKLSPLICSSINT